MSEPARRLYHYDKFPAKGQWRERRNGEIVNAVCLRCPRCGRPIDISVAFVDDDGTVNQIVACGPVNPHCWASKRVQLVPWDTVSSSWTLSTA